MDNGVLAEELKCAEAAVREAYRNEIRTTRIESRLKAKTLKIKVENEKIMRRAYRAEKKAERVVIASMKTTFQKKADVVKIPTKKAMIDITNKNYPGGTCIG